MNCLSTCKKILNKTLCRICKVHSTQYALFQLLQAWQKELNNSVNVGTILMELSKAYDCISHDLLIAKLEVYGPDKISLNILFDYPNNCKQRTKIGCSFSSWYDIITGIPQGSILGPLLFNIFINDLFLLQIKSEICNFADDNTLYSCDKELGTVISNLKYDMTNILNWFRYNSMKANPDKFQFMILGTSDDKCFILKINSID